MSNTYIREKIRKNFKLSNSEFLFIGLLTTFLMYIDPMLSIIFLVLFILLRIFLYLRHLSNFANIKSATIDEVLRKSQSGDVILFYNNTNKNYNSTIIKLINEIEYGSSYNDIGMVYINDKNEKYLIQTTNKNTFCYQSKKIKNAIVFKKLSNVLQLHNGMIFYCKTNKNKLKILNNDIENIIATSNINEYPRNTYEYINSYINPLDDVNGLLNYGFILHVLFNVGKQYKHGNPINFILSYYQPPLFVLK